MPTHIGCPTEDRWVALLAGQLPGPDETLLIEHLDTCGNCQKTLETIAAGTDSLAALARKLGAAEDSEATRLVPAAPEPGLLADTQTSSGDRSTLLTNTHLYLALLTPSSYPGSLGRVGHYEVLEEVGRGGMGRVLKALDTKLQRVVAIKLLAPELAASSLARQRFVREAQTAAGVSDENVVPVHTVDDAGPVPYLVMEFIEGNTLEGLVRQSGPLTVEEILRVGERIARGLAAAHARGLIHRDVKPGNVLLEAKTARIKLTDFGLARAIDDASTTGSGVIAGTPLYMSPEQARGERIDHRSDLFSLGSVLYTMCAGVPAFQAETAMGVLKRVCDDAPRSLRAVNPAIPGKLVELVNRLMHKNPAQRFQSASEVAELLAGYLEQVRQAGPAAIDTAPPRRGRKWLLGGMLLAAVAAVVFWPVSNRNTPLPPDPDTTQPAADRNNPLPPGPRTNPPASEEAEAVLPPFANPIGMEFIYVPAGRAWLGGTANKPGTREVRFERGFYLGKYEVTQGEWMSVMSTNPSAFSRTGYQAKAVRTLTDEELKRMPVELVSWYDAEKFAAALNNRHAKPGWEYRLPREDEWEYACRGGPMDGPEQSGFDFYFAKPTNVCASNAANFAGTGSVGRPVPVGRYPPNSLGLCDMHGNVYEWCSSGEAGPNTTSEPHRGGCWEFDAEWGTASVTMSIGQGHVHSSLGLRLALVRVKK